MRLSPRRASHRRPPAYSRRGVCKRGLWTALGHHRVRTGNLRACLRQRQFWCSGRKIDGKAIQTTPASARRVDEHPEDTFRLPSLLRSLHFRADCSVQPRHEPIDLGRLAHVR